MVNDQAKSGMPLGESRNVLQVPRQDGDDIERQVRSLEERECGVHVVAHHPVGVGLVVHEVPQADDSRVCRPSLEDFGKGVVIRERCPGDNPGDSRPDIRRGDHGLGVGDRRRRLYEHDIVDSGGRRERFSVGDPERAVDDTEFRSEP